MSKLSFDHVHYRSSNFDKTLEFYVKIMGGKKMPNEVLGGNQNLHIELGGITLLFIESTDEIPMSADILGAYHIAFLVDSCKDATAYYVSQGAKVAISQKSYSETITASFLAAPDGMMVEIKEVIS